MLSEPVNDGQCMENVTGCLQVKQRVLVKHADSLPDNLPYNKLQHSMPVSEECFVSMYRSEFTHYSHKITCLV